MTSHLLDKIENGHSIADRTEDGISVVCEEDISLSVNGSAEIGKLNKYYQ